MISATRRRKLSDGTIRLTPTVRQVRSIGATWDDRYIVELYDDFLAVRPRGAKRGGPAYLTIGWGSLVQHLAVLKLEARRREKAKAHKARRGRRTS